MRKHLLELRDAVLVTNIEAFPCKGNPFAETVNAIDEFLYGIRIARFDIRIRHVAVAFRAERACAYLRKQELVDTMFPVVFPYHAAVAEHVHVHNPLFPCGDVIGIYGKR